MNSGVGCFATIERTSAIGCNSTSINETINHRPPQHVVSLVLIHGDVGIGVEQRLIVDVEWQIREVLLAARVQGGRHVDGRLAIDSLID